MVTAIGIFDIDNAQDVDQAVERLAAARFDDTVYNEAIVLKIRATSLLSLRRVLLRRWWWAVSTPIRHLSMSGAPLSAPLGNILPNTTCLMK